MTSYPEPVVWICGKPFVEVTGTTAGLTATRDEIVASRGKWPPTVATSTPGHIKGERR